MDAFLHLEVTAKDEAAKASAEIQSLIGQVPSRSNPLERVDGVASRSNSFDRVDGVAIRN